VNVARNGDKILIYGYYLIKSRRRDKVKYKLYTILLLSRYLDISLSFSHFCETCDFLISFILRITTKRLLLFVVVLQADKLSQRDTQVFVQHSLVYDYTSGTLLYLIPSV